MGDHTPTPWTANPDGWQPWQGAIQIVGADGYVVAYTATGGPEKENAELLCKAASNHGALVKALEEIAGDPTGVSSYQADIAKAALGKVSA